jgi:phosphoribosylaminoimidazole-succinocarboxamide synthase
LNSVEKLTCCVGKLAVATIVRQGKVRDVYDIGDYFLMVASDRISAFDHILPSLIPDKGRVLTQISKFWFEKFEVPNHLVSTDVRAFDIPDEMDIEHLAGRSMIVKKCEVVPIECVIRGYLVGSGWKDYQQSGAVCGIDLPNDLIKCSKLPEAIFTPATKSDEGHDENISFQQMVDAVGIETATTLRDQSMSVYERGRDYAAEKGIILADTKFEWGLHDGELILIDEVLTPDSSRFWPADQYTPGQNQFSFDKQFVRDWLETTDWDKESTPPDLPLEVVQKTREKYIEAYERLTEKTFEWK